MNGDMGGYVADASVSLSGHHYEILDDVSIDFIAVVSSDESGDSGAAAARVVGNDVIVWLWPLVVPLFRSHGIGLCVLSVDCALAALAGVSNFN